MMQDKWEPNIFSGSLKLFLKRLRNARGSQNMTNYMMHLFKN